MHTVLTHSGIFKTNFIPSSEFEKVSKLKLDDMSVARAVVSKYFNIDKKTVDDLDTFTVNHLTQTLIESSSPNVKNLCDGLLEVKKFNSVGNLFTTMLISVGYKYSEVKNMNFKELVETVGFEFAARNSFKTVSDALIELFKNDMPKDVLNTLEDLGNFFGYNSNVTESQEQDMELYNAMQRALSQKDG